MAKNTLGRHKSNIEGEIKLPSDPECERCSLNENALTVCMNGYGNNDADLMIVGEAPGSNEDDEGRPFVGVAGRYLRQVILPSAGIDESIVRFTNAVRCRPKQNKTPTVNNIKLCRPYLEYEIKKVKPKVIVGVGNIPLASLLQFFYKGKGEEGVADRSSKVSGISKWRGKKIWLSEFNCWFIPTFHPSYAKRMLNANSEFITNVMIHDFEIAMELLYEDLPDIPKLNTYFLKDKQDILNMLNRMWGSEVFSFDIETKGTGKAIDRDIIGVSFSDDGREGFFVEWKNVINENTVKKKFFKLITSKNHLKIMHNGAYEIRIFNFHNYPIYDNYFDTMLAAHVIDENFEKKLKSLAWIDTFYGGYDVELEKYKKEHKIKADYGLIPMEILAPYGAMDAIVTFLLYEKYIKRMKEEKVFKLFTRIIMPIRRVMSDAEYYGIRVDKERAIDLKLKCEQALDKIEDDIYSICGDRFNINSSDQLGNYLFKKLKYKPLKKTKTGKYSVDKETIDYLTVSYPDDVIFKHLSDRAYITTMLKTHISQAINFVWEDGRVHTHYNIAGTVTGRASCSEPSIHNIPQDGLIRSLYMASDGHVIIEADLKSAELVYLAAVSGEEAFVNAFENGLDIHSVTYRKIKGLPDDYECSKLERRFAKAVNFGIVYGITAFGLAKRLGISVEEADDFINMYLDNLPMIKRYLEKEKRLVRKKGYVVSVFGRKRRLPLALSDSEYDYGRAVRQAYNSPIQSGAADYAYISLIRLWRELRKRNLESKLIHSVHDCGLVDTILYEKEEIHDVIKKSFETPVKELSVTMKVEIEENKYWGIHNESRLRDIFEKFKLV